MKKAIILSIFLERVANIGDEKGIPKIVFLSGERIPKRHMT